MQTMNVCKHLCGECPFSNKSLNGWLADYTIEDIATLQRNEALFPCHKLTAKGGMSQDDVKKALENGTTKLCRGYIESTIKSAKQPRYNIILKQAMEQVRQEGTHQESMAIWDFRKHHTL